jgi:hypothetical protein
MSEEVRTAKSPWLLLAAEVFDLRGSTAFAKRGARTGEPSAATGQGINAAQPVLVPA